MTKRILTYLLAAPLLLWASCSSDQVLEEVVPVINDSQDPMRFSIFDDSYQLTRTNDNLPNLLRQGFLVSCYKNFGNTNQQEVMPMYEVNFNLKQYNTWYDEKTSWNYISSEESEFTFYQTQYEKYWDYSAFPYRFHAVTPAPISTATDGTKTLNSGFSLTGAELKIPTAYQYQNSKDGVTTPANSVAEPHLAAQVMRDTDGKDYDLLVKDDEGKNLEINKSSATKNRSVALPFHHLNSKVRFAIYCPNLGEDEEDHRVTEVVIKAKSKNVSGFITLAKYQADLTQGKSILDGSFTKTNETNSGAVNLIELSASFDYDNNSLQKTDKNFDLVNARKPETAYWFECPNGLMQIPQSGIELYLSCKIEGKFESEAIGDFDNPHTIIVDRQIILNDDAHTSVFEWEKNHAYTYYIIVGPFIPTDREYPIVDGSGKDIYFTCVVEPWEDVQGSMEAGLEGLNPAE